MGETRRGEGGSRGSAGPREGLLTAAAIAAVEDATGVYKLRSLEVALGFAALFPLGDLVFDLLSGQEPQWASYGLTLLGLVGLLCWLRRRPYSRAVAGVMMVALIAGYASSVFLPRPHDGDIVIFFIFTPLAYFLLGAGGGLAASLVFGLVATAVTGASAIGLLQVDLGPYRFSQVLMADLALVFQNVFGFASERRHRRSLFLLLERSYLDEETRLPNPKALGFERLEAGELLVLVSIVNFRDLLSLTGALEPPLDLGIELASSLGGWASEAGGLQRGPYRLAEAEFAFVFGAGVEAGEVAGGLEEFLAGRGVAEASPLRFRPRIVSYRPGRAETGSETLESALACLVDCAALGRTVFHREGGEEGRSDLVSKASLLIRNIRESRFHPLFQPVYDFERGGIGFLEALIRLEEEGRFVSPEAYLDAATRLGLLGSLSDYMLEASLDLVRSSGHSVSFNVDFSDLERPDFRRRLLRAAAGLSGEGRLIVELTEHSAYVDAKEVGAFSQELHEAGGLVFLDDFGSGYSNYASLLELRVDAVKATGSIVREIGRRHEAATLYRGMTSFCAAAGIEVVAEHVSDEHILSLAREGGARFIQGYWISEPLEARRVIEGSYHLPEGLSTSPRPLGGRT